MSPSTTLQNRLTALVLTNPEVLTLYSARPVLAEIASHTVNAVIRRQTQPPAVLVSETDSDTTVAVSVGLSGENSATAVCRDLYDSITTEMTAAGATRPFNVAIKISSIA
jgi:hypothetical protein